MTMAPDGRSKPGPAHATAFEVAPPTAPTIASSLAFISSSVSPSRTSANVSIAPVGGCTNDGWIRWCAVCPSPSSICRASGKHVVSPRMFCGASPPPRSLAPIAPSHHSSYTSAAGRPSIFSIVRPSAPAAVTTPE